MEKAIFIKNRAKKSKKGGWLKENYKFILVGILLIIVSQFSFASSTDMPWEGPLDKLLKSFTGPVAKTVGILAICICGGMMAVGEMGSAMKRMLNVVFGISLIFAASTWGLSFFGFSGSVQM